MYLLAITSLALAIGYRNVKQRVKYLATGTWVRDEANEQHMANFEISGAPLLEITRLSRANGNFERMESSGTNLFETFICRAEYSIEKETIMRSCHRWTTRC